MMILKSFVGTTTTFSRATSSPSSSSSSFDSNIYAKRNHKKDDSPRIIVVKKKVEERNSAEPAEGGSSTITPKNLSDRVGRFVRKPKLFKKGEVIKDTAGQDILIPGTDDKKLRLPVINASALLNTQSYCIQSAKAATSRSGTEAARRLLRGKKEWLSVIKTQVLYNNIDSYVLQGHGIPVQLLQNHVDLADAVLRQCQANLVTFADLETVKVRNTNGTSHQQPFILNEDMNDAMQLYTTVMERLVKKLAIVLKQPASSSPTTTTSPSDNNMYVDEYDNTWSETPSGQTQLKWKAEFLKGVAFPADWLPNEDAVVPIVKWTLPRPGMAPKVSIRLQGYPTSTNTSIGIRRKRRKGVSLYFEAKL